MQKVRVGLERRSYDIMIGQGLIINSGSIIKPLLSQNRVVVITDQNVAPLHLRSYESSMRSAGISVSSLVLPSGEGTKSWKYVCLLYTSPSPRDPHLSRMPSSA